MKTDPSCVHTETLPQVRHPSRPVCEECVKLGDEWFHLRTCQECGMTLCCDSSVNHHASKHAQSTGHPLIASAQPGERWLFCYPDELYAEY
jgi:hypothetical protein